MAAINFNIVFRFLLWCFRIFGLFPASNTKWIEIVSKIFSGLHFIFNGILVWYLFYVAENYLQQFQGEIYVYVGFGLYASEFRLFQI